MPIYLCLCVSLYTCIYTCTVLRHSLILLHIIPHHIPSSDKSAPTEDACLWNVYSAGQTISDMRKQAI